MLSSRGSQAREHLVCRPLRTNLAHLGNPKKARVVCECSELRGEPRKMSLKRQVRTDHMRPFELA